MDHEWDDPKKSFKDNYEIKDVARNKRIRPKRTGNTYMKSEEEAKNDPVKKAPSP